MRQQHRLPLKEPLTGLLLLYAPAFCKADTAHCSYRLDHALLKNNSYYLLSGISDILEQVERTLPHIKISFLESPMGLT